MGRGRFQNLEDAPGWITKDNPGPGRSKLVMVRIGTVKVSALGDTGQYDAGIIALEILNSVGKGHKSPVRELSKYRVPSVLRGFLKENEVRVDKEMAVEVALCTRSQKSVTKILRFKLIPDGRLGATAREIIIGQPSLAKLGFQLLEHGYEFHAMQVVTHYEEDAECCNRVHEVVMRIKGDISLEPQQTGFVRVTADGGAKPVRLEEGWLRS